MRLYKSGNPLDSTQFSSDDSSVSMLEMTSVQFALLVLLLPNITVSISGKNEYDADSIDSTYVRSQDIGSSKLEWFLQRLSWLVSNNVSCILYIICTWRHTFASFLDTLVSYIL